MSRAAADSLQRPRCSKGCINVYFSQQSTSCGSVAVQFKLPAWTRLQASLLIWEKKKKILKKERFQFGKRPICCGYRHIYSPMSHSHVLHSVSYCSFHLSTFTTHTPNRKRTHRLIFWTLISLLCSRNNYLEMPALQCEEHPGIKTMKTENKML